MEKEFQEAIYYQANQVENQKIPRSSKSDFKLLTNELEELDKQYKLYTELIGRVGYNEDLGMKVIEYFSLKLELLRKIQLEIIKVNNFEKSNNDENNKINLHI
jgi:hypothetical protein